MRAQRELRSATRSALYALVVLAGALAASNALSQGVGIEAKGLVAGDRFDTIVGRAFTCHNQHGKKRYQEWGFRPLPCLAEGMLLSHLQDEHAARTDIVTYLKDRRGVCRPAVQGKACRVVRKVSRRWGNTVETSALTTFTVDIEINSDGHPTRASIDRYDLYGWEQKR